MLARMLNLFPRRDICALDGTLYLQRWTLLRVFGRKVMVHRIAQPDGDRDPHDHPFNFVTVILKGGYSEQVRQWRVPDDPDTREAEERVARRLGLRAAWRDDVRLNLAPTIRFNPARHTHRIRELLDGPCWTLVLRGKRQREWGFDTDCGWQRWDRFIRKKRRGIPICED